MKQASRMLPHSRETEEIFVGGLLARAEWMEDVVDLVRPDDFYDPFCERLWETMTRLYDLNQPVDMMTVAQILSPQKPDTLIHNLIPLTTKGAEYLASFNVRDYAQKIRELSERRRLMKAGESIIRLALEGKYGSSRELFDEAEQCLYQVEPDQSEQGGLTPITELAGSYVDYLESIYSHQGTVSGVSSGYPSLDAYLGGFQKQDFIVVGARPSIGKTTFALNIGNYVARQPDTYFAFFSLEMDKDRGLMNRIVSSQTNIELQRLRSGFLEGDHWTKITVALSELPERLLVDDTVGMTVTHIRRETRRLRRKIGPEAHLVVAIDYLQHINRPRNMSRYDFVTEAAMQLKELARECDCTVIALSQLSRGVEQRENKRPMLSDLRESGQIEQEADIVAFLHRDDYYDPETEKRGILEILIAKHRNGMTGTVELAFLKPFQKLLELERGR